LPSSTWNLAPAGKLSPSGNCTSATGARVSAGTRTLTRTINWPVLVRTALCSIAHSSGAPRLALLHRATQPGGAGVFAPSAAAAAGAGVACAPGAALLLALGAWAWLWPHKPDIAAAAIANLTRIFTEPAPK
jgi:hypothetical protein